MTAVTNVRLELGNFKTFDWGVCCLLQWNSPSVTGRHQDVNEAVSGSEDSFGLGQWDPGGSSIKAVKKLNFGLCGKCWDLKPECLLTVREREAPAPLTRTLYCNKAEYYLIITFPVLWWEFTRKLWRSWAEVRWGEVSGWEPSVWRSSVTIPVINSTIKIIHLSIGSH